MVDFSAFHVGKYTIIYHPGTQTTLVLNGKGLVLEWLTFKNRGHLGSRILDNSHGCVMG